VDYFREGRVHGSDGLRGWGPAGDPDRLWSLRELLEIKDAINRHGLELAAIENFDPAHWYDVLLAGPRREQQLEGLKTIIRRIGEADIPVMGYNFSIAGVWAHQELACARGDAMAVGFDCPENQSRIPRGQVWNMTYDSDLSDGDTGIVTSQQLWDRLQVFLDAIVPVAEEAGVRLAAHPDDPPMPTLRGTARLVYQPSMYDRLLNLKPSHSNALEFCLGTIAEMTEGNIYDAIAHYAAQDAIAYVHFRNVRGKVPSYREMFVDDGDVDMLRALRLLREHNYSGVIIPDHTPLMSCDAPWHAGMAHAIGYIRVGIQAIEKRLF
jgi:mannonate dehydratase